MVITMPAVGVVQVPIDQIVRVIAMGDGGMTAIGTMDMAGGMAPTGMILGASIRIGRADGNGMFLDHFPILMVEVTIVDIVDMSFMLDGGVTAAWTMNVVMVIVVFATFRHERIPWVKAGPGYSLIGRKPEGKHPFRFPGKVRAIDRVFRIGRPPFLHGGGPNGFSGRIGSGQKRFCPNSRLHEIPGAVRGNCFRTTKSCVWSACEIIGRFVHEQDR